MWPDLAASFKNLGAIYYKQGKYPEAAPLLQRALEIQERTLGLDNPDVALSLADLAEAFRVQHKYVEAERHCRKALNIKEKILGSDHPNIADSLESLAALMRKTKRKGKAAKLEARAQAIRARNT